MHVNPGKLLKLIKKASFNYVLDTVSLSFESDKITSRMVSPSSDFAVLIDAKNDVLRNGDEKVELNFLLDDRFICTTAKNTFRNFNNENFHYNLLSGMHEAKVEIHEDKFEITTAGGSIALNLCEPSQLDRITWNTGSRPMKDCIWQMDVNEDFVKRMLSLKKICRHNDSVFMVNRNRISVDQKTRTGEVNKLEFLFNIPLLKDTEEEFKFRYRYFLQMLEILKSETDQAYEIRFFYDKNQGDGAICVIAKDRSERYSLRGERNKGDVEKPQTERHPLTDNSKLKFKVKLDVQKHYEVEAGNEGEARKNAWKRFLKDQDFHNIRCDLDI